MRLSSPNSAAPDGMLWVSGPLRGSVRDLTAARIWGVIRAPAASGLLVLAVNAYQGAGAHILTPRKGRDKPESLKDAAAHTPSSAAPANARTRSFTTGSPFAGRLH